MLQQYHEKNKNLVVNIGGELVHRDEAGVSPFDSTVQNGDGVWEGLRLYDGKIFKLAEHLARLRRSAEALQYADIPADEAITGEIKRTLVANGMRDGVHIRLTLSRGLKYTSGLDPRINTAGSTLIVLAEHKPPVYDKTGVRLITAKHRRPPENVLDQKIHNCNQLTSILAKLEANAAGADDALMLDTRGFVAETNATHVFIVHGGVVLTPTTVACPEGITRSVVLDLCRESGIPHEVRDVAPGEVFAADEMFCTGTMGEIAPVVEVDGRTIGGGTMGAVTRRLGELFAELVLRDGEVVVELEGIAMSLPRCERTSLAIVAAGLIALSSTAGADDSGPLRIVAFGDSTTAPRDTVELNYAERLARALAGRGIRAEVINTGGAPGDTTADARRRFERDVVHHDPDMVVIEFGLNDSATGTRVSIDDYRLTLHGFVDALEARGVGVVVMTPNPIRGAHGVRGYADAVRGVAREHGVPLVDVYRMFEAFDRMDGQTSDDLLLDGMHPNDRGHRLIADRLDAVLSPVLRARAGAAPPRGYTIPIVDLADQTHRQVIVDREPGQYLGHPTTVLLEDGLTMITVYPKGHGRGGIVMKRSTDGGLTWSERLPVPDNWSTSKEVPTLHRVVDSRGVKRIIMFSGLYPTRLAVSEDDGHTWTGLAPVGEWGGIVVMGCVERLANGDYMAMFHDDGRFIREGGKRSEVMQLFKTFSRDGGLTWGEPELIYENDSIHLCEPGIIRSPDGKQLAVLLRENRRRRNSHVILSNDEGRSWSTPRELPGALTGDRHTGKYAPDGRLFISFRDTALESPTQGDWVGWVGTYDDIVEGREGQYRVRLLDNHHRWDCAYPGVEILPDGTFVTTTYGHWIEGEQPFIVSVRFTLDELDP